MKGPDRILRNGPRLAASLRFDDPVETLLHLALLDRELRHRLAPLARQGADRRRKVGREELLERRLDLGGRIFARKEQLVAKVGELGAD